MDGTADIRTPKNILLAISSARGDDRAVDRGLQLAGQWSAPLTILHVTDNAARQRTGRNRSSDEIFDEITNELSQHPLSRKIDPKARRD